MSYSCSDFVADVVNEAERLGILKRPNHRSESAELFVEAQMIMTKLRQYKRLKNKLKEKSR